MSRQLVRRIGMWLGVLLFVAFNIVLLLFGLLGGNWAPAITFGALYVFIALIGVITGAFEGWYDRLPEKSPRQVQFEKMQREHEAHEKQVQAEIARGKAGRHL